MTEEEQKLMDQYGITSQQKIVYHYNGHNYDNLKDAISFAKIDTQRKWIWLVAINSLMESNVSTIKDIKIKGLDPNRKPSLKNKNYVDLIFELTQKAPRDWCADFNTLFSKNKHNAKINPDEGLYVETWVRNINDIPNELELIKQLIIICNNNYIEQMHQEALAWQQSENNKTNSRSDELDRILASLSYN